MSVLTTVAAALQGPRPEQSYIVLAGRRSPGVCRVRGAGTPRNFDIQQGYGVSGASLIYKGAGLAKFEVDIIFWDDDSLWGLWDDFEPVLAAPTQNNPNPLSISHPLLNAPPLNILSVEVEDVTQWEQDEDGGPWICTIKFVQYRKPVLAVVKVPEGPPGSPVNVQPDARTAVIAENQKIIKDLL